MTVTRVALVSATGTGRKRFLPALRDSTLCQVTALSGRDRAALEGLAAEFGVPHTYGSLEDMIAAAEFDVAIVCSPPFLHREQLELLLSAGVPALCEKPLALTEGDANVIREAAARSEGFVMIAHQLRHQSIYREIRDRLRGGEIGEVATAFMEWQFTMDRSAHSATWKQDPRLNGLSALADAGVHCLDMAIGLFGPGEVARATSPGPSSTGVFESCEIEALHGAVRVATKVSRLRGPIGNQLVITGTKGEIRAPMFFSEASAPAIFITGVKGRVTIERTPGNPYRAEVEDFAHAALHMSYSSPGTSLEEGVAACRMLDQAHALLAVGKTHLCYNGNKHS